MKDKFQNNAGVICTQGENEDREEFISKNGITFSENQYGSNEMLKLVYDSSGIVRKAVADQGYGLDILIHDKYVCEVVNAYLKEHNLTLDQWKEQKRNMQKRNMQKLL